MGGFSSSSRSGGYAEPALMQALAYSFAAHKRRMDLGKAGPVRLPLPESTPAPAPQQVQVKYVYREPPPLPPAPKPAGQGPAPASPPAATPDPQAEAAQRRKDQLDRQTRGRGSMIATSWRGVLSPSGAAGGRKTLLGE